MEWFNVETAVRLVSYRSLGHVMQKMKRHLQAKGEADWVQYRRTFESGEKAKVGYIETHQWFVNRVTTLERKR